MNKTTHKIIKIASKNKKIVFLFIFWIIVLCIFDSTYPLVNKYVLDNYFTESTTYPNLVLVMTYYFGSAIIFFFTVRGMLKNAVKIEAHISYELRKEAYENIEKLSFSYYDKTPNGQILASMTSASRRLANIFSWGLLDLLWGLTMMISILVVMFIVDYRLAFIIAGLCPIIFVFCLFCNRKILKGYRKTRKKNDMITASFNEQLIGIKTSKTLVIEDKNYKEFGNQVHDYKKEFMKTVIISSVIFPVVFFIMCLGLNGTLVVGTIIGVSVGTIYLFTDFAVKFFEPIQRMARVMADFQDAKAAAERIISLIETKPEIIDSEEVIEKYGDVFNPKKKNWEDLIGDVEFKNVSFGYNESEIIIKNFNLKIDAGSSVALVGKTGSGKTTIINLLSRFYEPTEGEILIDGSNYKNRSLGWLHSNIGYVLQTPQLFSGTIMENIRYGRIDATDEEVISSAKMVNAHEFILCTEGGYNTIVNEGGNNLSLGEKQLISFARAVLTNPKILVLDEATSSIDTVTEEAIKRATNKVMKNRTSLIISHRLSTIINSDLILVIDDGKIVESGTHKELLHQYGHYYELYKEQFIKEMYEKTK